MTTTTKKPAAKKAAPKKATAPKKAAPKKPAPARSGLGLDAIGDLSGLLNQPEGGSGRPIEIPLDLIDEDPNQPRHADNPGFSPESIAEIGASIQRRGVKSPISVREHPEVTGRFIINHGARRYRGSKWAEKAVIPAYIDNDYTEADQVVENLQRNELTPREIADFIGRELACGRKKGEIAKEIGKSPAFVSQHVTLLDLPEPVAEAFNGGRVNDVTVVNELVTAYKKKPEAVSDWLADDTQEVTRGTVKLLREFLDEKRRQDGAGTDAGGLDAGDGSSDEDKPPAAPPKTNPPEDPEKLKKAIVQVFVDGRGGRLVLSRRPTAEGRAWVKYDDDGHEFEADLADVKLLAVLEG